jgi:CubicO group peptidase (beta-lactamase class C family)
MILPELNEMIFDEAVERVKPSLISGNLDCALLGVRHNGREMVRCLDSKTREIRELREKSISLASISKAITGTAVAHMVDKKVVRWADPLAKYLADMKDGSDNERITIGDVFLHRTGYSDADPISPEAIPSYEAYRNILKAGFKLKPRTAFLYGTTSYWFINALVHRTLGFTSMQDFLKEWIFAPCGMTQTSFAPPPKKRMELLNYYSGTDLDRFMKAEIPGSGLWSSMDDLLKFGQAVITPGKLMRETTFMEMVEAYPMKKHGEEGFSCRTLGWVKEINFNNQPLRGFFHGGATGGVLWCDPKADFVAVFMSNKWGAGNSDAFKAISAFYETADHKNPEHGMQQ